MDRFFSDAAKGTLPALTWIDPRQGINKTLGNLGGPNSDHPSCCDVALGERLRKDIYEALRAGPGWNETAFIMTWDDPGGFYDHARPRVLDAPLCHRHAVAAIRLTGRRPRRCRRRCPPRRPTTSQRASALIMERGRARASGPTRGSEVEFPCSW